MYPLLSAMCDGGKDALQILTHHRSHTVPVATEGAAAAVVAARIEAHVPRAARVALVE